MFLYGGNSRFTCAQYKSGRTEANAVCPVFWVSCPRARDWGAWLSFTLVSPGVNSACGFTVNAPALIPMMRTWPLPPTLRLPNCISQIQSGVGSPGSSAKAPGLWDLEGKDGMSLEASTEGQCLLPTHPGLMLQRLTLSAPLDFILCSRDWRDSLLLTCTPLFM